MSHTKENRVRVQSRSKKFDRSVVVPRWPLARLGFFAHRPQDMCTKNVRPRRSQSFKTIQFQLLWILCPPQSLFVSQYMVCEAGPIHWRKKWPPRGQKFSDYFKFFKLGLTELTSASGHRRHVLAVYLSLSPPPLHYILQNNLHEQRMLLCLEQTNKHYYCIYQDKLHCLFKNHLRNCWRSFENCILCPSVFHVIPNHSQTTNQKLANLS